MSITVNVNLLRFDSVDQISGTEFSLINSIKKILVENKIQPTEKAVYIFKGLLRHLFMMTVAVQQQKSIRKQLESSLRNINNAICAFEITHTENTYFRIL